MAKTKYLHLAHLQHGILAEMPRSDNVYFTCTFNGSKRKFGIIQFEATLEGLQLDYTSDAAPGCAQVL